MTAEIERRIGFARANMAVIMVAYVDREHTGGRLSWLTRKLAIQHAREALDRWEALVGDLGQSIGHNPFIGRDGFPIAGHIVMAIVDDQSAWRC